MLNELGFRNLRQLIEALMPIEFLTEVVRASFKLDQPIVTEGIGLNCLIPFNRDTQPADQLGGGALQRVSAARGGVSAGRIGDRLG